MPPCYICSPFAGDVPENLRRAVALSRLALGAGHAPLCVHPAIAAGCYGDDGVPEERKVGLRAVCALVEAVAWAGGDFWLLLRDDGTISAGCQPELDVWRREAGRAAVVWRWVDGAPRRDP